jgi:CheY-like chemotaxis protein
MEVLDLVPLANAAVEVIAPTAAARGVHIERDLQGGPYHVCADHDRLQQVLWTLLSNAVKFTPKEGRVTVRVRRENDDCLVEVQDTRQADGSMSREHDGLGRGLAIVHEVVEMHGGTVTASSGGSSLGAIFTVRLPTASPAEAPAEFRPHPYTAVLSGRPVLVIDDDEDTREIAAAALTSAGANVVVAPSAAEALTQLERSTFSVLICDIGMPQMDGYELLRQVRARDGHNRAIPAIALTAYASSADVARAHAAGFHLHIAKPFNVAALVNAVATLGERKVDRREPGVDSL